MEANHNGESEKRRRPLRAKPIKGEIDWRFMIDEQIARYPNIIAALAEAEKRCADRKREG